MVVDTCPDCNGHRLRKESLHFKINGAHIGELTKMDVQVLYDWLEEAEKTLEPRQAQIAHEREGMRRINSQGCENRKDRCLKVVINPESLALIELFVIQQMGAVVEKLAFQARAVMLLLLVQ